MMPAAKHGDVQMGVDIHLCTVPTPAPTPTPLPTPHMSVVFDPFDYLPVIGATVTVCGMKRAVAGTAGKVVHIPPGFPFAPKLPDNEDELFMGSSTVVADGDPMSHIAHPVLACQAAGSMSPFRLRRKGGPRAMVLPTVFNLATPTTVFVGGPPTISMMGMAMKGVFAGLGKLAKSGVFKRMRQKLFKNMKPGFLKCKILRAEPVNIVSGAVVVEQRDFALAGRLSLQWLRCYASDQPRSGVLGPGWETPVDIRLDIDADGSVTLQGPGVGPSWFAALPAAVGDAAAQHDNHDGARLADDGDAWTVQTSEDRCYRFPKAMRRPGPDGAASVPVAAITDLCGNAMRFEYRGGVPVAIDLPGGRRLALAHADGRLRAVTLLDAASRTEHGFVRYQYDAEGRLEAAFDALGQAHRFAYDGGLLVRHTDRNGLAFHYAFDAGGPQGRRVVRAWGDGDLHDHRFEYLDALDQRRITDPAGGVWQVQLDERSLPISEIDPLGGMTVFGYDEAGRPNAVTDPAGRRTVWHFDALGRLLALERPDGGVIAFERDAQGRPVAVTDPCGARWQQQWDARGLLLAQVSPRGDVQRCRYDAHGQLVEFKNARGARTRFAFDAVGHLAELTEPLGARTRFVHDALGRLATRAGPDGRLTRYRHDALGRLLAIERPDGSVHFTYDAEGRVVEQVDARGARTRWAHAGTASRTRRTDADGRETLYRYDREERLVGVCNPRGEWWQLTLDALGRIAAEVDYWGQHRSHRYDAGGHLTATVDPLGRTVGYRCDAMGRVVERTLPPPAGQAQPWRETFAYDACGRLVAAANGHAEIQRELDAEGRVLVERQRHADGHEVLVENRFDACGNRIARSSRSGADTTGHRCEFAYDLADHHVGLRVDGVAVMRVQRDDAGRAVGEAFGDGLERRLRYGDDGLIAEAGLLRDGVALFATRWLWDPSGELVQRHDSQYGIDRFVHDAVGRVVEHVDAQGHAQAWRHEPGGDRLAAAVCDGTPWRRAGHYDGIDAVFDRAGQMVQRRDGRATLDLVWDALGRLVASRRRCAGATVTAEYGCDPLGRRVFKRSGGRLTRFAWDGDLLLADEAGARRREFVHAPESTRPLLMLQADDGAAARRYWVCADPNGCPVRLVDDGGVTRWAVAHGAWGAVTATHVGEVDMPLRLPGQYHDDETGLHYNRFRWFDPATGQFVCADPIGLVGGSGVYGYGANAQRWADPLGLSGVITNKFPDEALPTDGKVFPHSVQDGKIVLDKPGAREFDFVVTKDNQLVIGKRHHLLGDRSDVLAAGQMKIRGDGTLVRVDNLSGHYRPSPAEAEGFGDALRRAGVNVEGATLQKWEHFVVDAEGHVRSVRLKPCKL